MQNLNDHATVSIVPDPALTEFLDSQTIHLRNFSLTPFPYCLSKKKRKFALRGVEHHNFGKLCNVMRFLISLTDFGHSGLDLFPLALK